MPDLVNQIKDQFVRRLEKNDSEHLLEVAEYHFEVAAKLRKKNIRYGNKKLLIRNSMKRLHLGIGVELLLKAAYLRKGICINKLKRGVVEIENSPIHLIESLDENKINSKETYSLNLLIDKYPQVFQLECSEEFLNGLKIAMVFRNKEGHTSFQSHEFEENNYKVISNAVIKLYQEAFQQRLKFEIAMQAKDKGSFKK